MSEEGKTYSPIVMEICEKIEDMEFDSTEEMVEFIIQEYGKIKFIRPIGEKIFKSVGLPSAVCFDSVELEKIQTLKPSEWDVMDRQIAFSTLGGCIGNRDTYDSLERECHYDIKRNTIETVALMKASLAKKNPIVEEDGFYQKFNKKKRWQK